MKCNNPEEYEKAVQFYCNVLGLPVYRQWAEGILIDAGISARQIQKDLREMGLDYRNIHGVLITHDHADHIRSVGTLGERVHLPIYTTREIHSGIDRNYGVKEKLKTSRRYFEKALPWELLGMRIQTFGISHDSTDCLGYAIDYLGQRFVIITDCGEPNPDMEHYISTANHLVIEANHDEEMLKGGAYPEYLKTRVAGNNGHLSNSSCAEALAENASPELKHVWLCHLSEENNHPELARKTVEMVLRSHGIIVGKDFLLDVLKRNTPSELYDLT
jgi:phosphoribosyl 1,2-cyclic phosphodiesterase